jgi:acyl-CoA reductase-like NAD-dependent aldehyde dehydrogenase
MLQEACALPASVVGADDRGDERRIAVRNPYTGAVVGTVPKATLDEVRAPSTWPRPTRAG